MWSLDHSYRGSHRIYRPSEVGDPTRLPGTFQHFCCNCIIANLQSWRRGWNHRCPSRIIGAAQLINYSNLRHLRYLIPKARLATENIFFFSSIFASRTSQTINMHRWQILLCTRESNLALSCKARSSGARRKTTLAML